MPEAPTGLAAGVGSGFEVTFQWDAASDHETPASGLSYNLRVGTGAGLGDVVPPMIRTGGEVRLLPALGNAQMMRSRVIRFGQAGTYHWTVQAIDTGFRGGVFAGQESVDVPQFQLPVGYLPYVDEGDVQWGDFDADGDLDFAIQGSTLSGDILQVYRNGGGTFTNLDAGLTGPHEGKAAGRTTTSTATWTFSPSAPPVPAGARSPACTASTAPGSPPSPRASWE